MFSLDPYAALPLASPSNPADQCLQDYFVEVDIVMDGSTPLWKAHDVSQQLQDKIEVLPNVERAFVHVDHEWTHVPVSTVSSRPLALTDLP